ncbi:hypothetical protein FRX31_018572, partial [Thalictrum thalictroides]
SHKVDFFKDLYTDPGIARPRLENLAFDTVSLEDRLDLERKLEEVEILSAIRALGADKTPGPE